MIIEMGPVAAFAADSNELLGIFWMVYAEDLESVNSDEWLTV